MTKSPSQTQSGKAFEYSILKEFEEKLSSKTSVKVIQNSALATAKKSFEFFDEQKRGQFLLTASFAVNFLMDIEPRLKNAEDENDILELEILTDQQGKKGDVRDVVVIRSKQNWEIGISAKNNHKALKHSRLSRTIDFGKDWFEIPCSKKYFQEVNAIFHQTEKMQEQNSKIINWRDLPDKFDMVYVPMLEAFRKELLKLYQSAPKQVASGVIESQVGKKDFYKVIRDEHSLEIQAFNLHGTLNLSFGDVQPKFKTPTIKLPDQITDISFKSKTTLIITFSDSWELSFRIHSASTKIEPSLKFDVQLEKAPSSLFTNTLSVT